MFIDILQNTAYQLIYTIGLVAVFGLAVGLLNKAFYKLVGYKFGRIVCIATGFIGVPIHEIGHALFCLLFGHKITEIKLYQPNSTDGTLGYVNHRYNPKNLYHQIGNFFIGFGPILFGCAVLLLLMFWLVPDMLAAFRNGSIAFHSFVELNNWRWWVFIVSACSIALHMSLSTADIKGSLVGFGFIAITLLIINTALYFVKIEAMGILTNYSLTAGVFALNFLTISVVFSLILLLFGVVICLQRNRKNGVSNK